MAPNTVPMGQTSGQYGAALNGPDPISTTGMWTVSATADQKTFVASNTAGGTGRRTGNLDWTGNCKQFSGWPMEPTMMPAGGQWDFLGFLAPRSGIPGGAGPHLGGVVLTDNVVLTIDWAASALIDLTTNFVGNGALAINPMPDEAAYGDLTPPIAIPSRDAVLEICLFSAGIAHDDDIPDANWFPLCALKATLTFKANMYPFSSSCTGGIVKRVAGTKDWSLVVTLDEPNLNTVGAANPVSLLRQNNYIGARIKYVTGEIIELRWGIVKDITNINCNIETGDMISYDVQIDMSVDSGPCTGVNGRVRVPIGNCAAEEVYEWWPDAVTVTGAGLTEGPALVLK